MKNPKQRSIWLAFTDTEAAMLLFIAEHTVGGLKIWLQLKQENAVFPEESESWRGIDRSLFALSSHIQAHCCSLCCASFTDRHTSIRVELGQRVRLVFVFACVDKYVRACLHQTETEKEDNEKKKRQQGLYWVQVDVSTCVFVCDAFDRWKMDQISFNSCIMSAQPGNRNNRYSIHVCVHMCVWLGGREQHSCVSCDTEGDDFSKLHKV